MVVVVAVAWVVTVPVGPWSKSGRKVVKVDFGLGGPIGDHGILVLPDPLLHILKFSNLLIVHCSVNCQL